MSLFNKQIYLLRTFSGVTYYQLLYRDEFIYMFNYVYYRDPNSEYYNKVPVGEIFTHCQMPIEKMQITFEEEIEPVIDRKLNNKILDLFTLSLKEKDKKLRVSTSNPYLYFLPTSDDFYSGILCKYSSKTNLLLSCDFEFTLTEDELDNEFVRTVSQPLERDRVLKAINDQGYK